MGCGQSRGEQRRLQLATRARRQVQDSLARSSTAGQDQTAGKGKKWRLKKITESQKQKNNLTGDKDAS